ncbi:transcription factor A, mitochondrial-like isoform X1 [Pomacea canaliculata]|uniref:transcription factor A, mitochondrial-like isoform X1 n=1 Tax=Pomacea canaliculata TaxID=400727 RepID=UPI000D72D0C7|nr:transcription factor A, mitochondrial-like isoform X1 [Pomacea canaliculata]
MAVVLQRCGAIADVFVKHLALTTLRPVEDARCLISMSRSIQSPDAPKRPLRPFVKFMTEKMSEIRQNNPGANAPKISKIASQLWNDLGTEKKTAYKLLAQEEYLDYKRKYLVFLDGLSEQEKAQLHDDKSAKLAFRKRLRDKKELRDLGKPKRPSNPYIAFVRSSLHERGGVPLNQFMKELADHWHNIPNEKKEIYEKDARVEKEKYKKELEEWEKKMIDIGREDVVRKSSLAKAKRTSISKVAKKSSSSGPIQKTVLVSPASRRKVTKKSHILGE